MVTFPLKFIMVLLGTFFIGILLTPLVRILAFKIDAVDELIKSLCLVQVA